MPYTFNSFTNPANLPAGNVDGLSLNALGTVLAVASSVAPYISTYAVDAGAHTLTRFALPAADLPGAANLAKIRPDGGTVYGLWNTSGGQPRLQVFSLLAGVLTKQTNPSIPNVTAAYVNRDICIISSNTLMLVASTNIVVRFSISGYGLTRITDIPVEDRTTGAIRGLQVSTDEQYVAAVHATAPFLTMYKINPDTTLTKLPGQSGGLAAQANCVAFHPTEPMFVVGYSSNKQPTIHTYDEDGNVTEVGSLPGLGAALFLNMKFHPNGDMLVMTGESVRTAFWMYKGSNVFEYFAPTLTNAPTYHTYGIDFNIDGSIMALGCRDATRVYAFEVIPPPASATVDLAATFPKATMKNTVVVMNEPEPPEDVARALVARTIAADAAPLTPSQGDAGAFGYVQAGFPKLSFAAAAGAVPDVELEASFPKLGFAASAGHVPAFTGAMTFPKLTGSISAIVKVQGPLDAVFPKLQFDAAGVLPTDLAILKASFPALTAEIVSLRPEGGWVYADFPALTAEIVAQRGEGAYLDATLPALSAAITAQRQEGVWFAATFPALSAEIAAQRNEGVWLDGTFPALSADALGGPDATARVQAAFPKLLADGEAKIGYTVRAGMVFPALSASLEALGDIGGMVSAEFPALVADASARFLYYVSVEAQFPALRFDARPPDPVDGEITGTFAALRAEGRFEQTRTGRLAAGFPSLTFAAESERSRRVDANIRFPKLTAAIRVNQHVRGELTASFKPLAFAGTYRRYYAADLAASFPSLKAEAEAKLLYRMTVAATFPKLAAEIEADWDSLAGLDAVFPKLGLEVSVRSQYKAELAAAFPRLRFAAATDGADAGSGADARPVFMGSGDAFNMGGGVVFATSKTWQIG